MQGMEFLAQDLAGSEHRFGHPLEHRLAGRQFPDASHEPAPAHWADLEFEATQNAADAELDVQELAL